MTLPLEDDSRPPYMQAAEVLRKEITQGRLKPGDKLPSARDLQERYGIASSTVQNALRLLKTEGLVFTVQGRGTFVRSDAAGAGAGVEVETRASEAGPRVHPAARMHSAEYNELAQQINELSTTVEDLRAVIRELTAAVQKKSRR
ncbi:winged helix-turn-helix domain-containing protein [Streptomyces olivoreticuli]|uniref:GntR family transcriptional regulator n=1 Tax=Streptomyces olivoreticuli TaxID=68246 RepID=UPI0026581444|nr:winged helix-turn-helix domain-containing protein [Streptomyces olivoreticuli]WKK27170.1 winged helix-turn-helix domain-containing protein [Streptomyces olivoreticuli]